MVYVYLEPVSAVLIAAALLGERLASWQVLGAALAPGGVWLASAGQPLGQGTRPAATEVSPGSATQRCGG